jgi:L-threonylcarbamoyladenylate synthase
MINEIEKSLYHLNNENLLLYPTDTVWGIGCDATNPVAVKKVYDLKQREDSKALICLVNSVEMLSEYVGEIPLKALPYLETADRPTTIIYPDAKNFANNLIAQDGSIAIRICYTRFCQELINRFGKPIVSTSANISGTPTAQTFTDIQVEIKNGVDYIVNLPDDNKPSKPSRIIRFDKQGKIHIIRE